MPTETG